MSLTLAMTGATLRPNDHINPLDGIHGGIDFWHGVAEQHGFIQSGQRSDNIKIIIAQDLTPKIAQDHAAQVWGLVNDADRRVSNILGQTLAKPEFSQLPFVAAMRAKIALSDAPAFTA